MFKNLEPLSRKCPLLEVESQNYNSDTIANLKALIESEPKKQRMIDRKKRVSYYFDPQTVEMVEVLSNRLAVKELYRQVIKK